MKPVIRFENVSKRYYLGSRRAYVNYLLPGFAQRKLRRNNEVQNQAKEIWALRNVSFEVRSGEALGIIGANGSGKTTMLKLMSHITCPTQGTIQINGRTSSLIELGAGFHPDLTGRENVYLNGVILGLSRREIDARFDEIVAFAELEKFVDTPVKRYSSGMYARLGFSVAAHVDPEILLVDEVLAVGDVNFQRKCSRRMRSLVEQSRTVIFVSHNLAAIRGLCQRVIWLDGGQIRAQGRPDEVIRVYADEMNRRALSTEGKGLHSAVRRGSGEVRFIHIETMDGDGEKTSHFLAGGVMRVRATYEVFEPIAPPLIGLVFRDVETGAFVTSVVQPVDDFPNETGGRGVVEWTFEPLLFRPRVYSLYLGIVDQQRNPIDIWDGAGSDIVISVPSADAADGYMPGIDSGLVSVPVRFHHEVVSG